MKSETVTLLLVNLASIMEKADEKLLPTLYYEVGKALQTDATGLGWLTSIRSIVQSLCYPLAAYLASNTTVPMSLLLVLSSGLQPLSFLPSLPTSSRYLSTCYSFLLLVFVIVDLIAWADF